MAADQDQRGNWTEVPQFMGRSVANNGNHRETFLAIPLYFKLPIMEIIVALGLLILVLGIALHFVELKADFFELRREHLEDEERLLEAFDHNSNQREPTHFRGDLHSKPLRPDFLWRPHSQMRTKVQYKAPYIYSPFSPGHNLKRRPFRTYKQTRPLLRERPVSYKPVPAPVNYGHPYFRGYPKVPTRHRRPY